MQAIGGQQGQDLKDQVHAPEGKGPKNEEPLEGQVQAPAGNARAPIGQDEDQNKPAESRHQAPAVQPPGGEVQAPDGQNDGPNVHGRAPEGEGVAPNGEEHRNEPKKPGQIVPPETAKVEQTY